MSILSDVKLDLGIDPEDTDFDSTIVRYINTAFSILNQLGVGPEHPFEVFDDAEEWDDFLSVYKVGELEMVKTYVSTKVAYMFDHPPNSSYANALKSINDELEWRLNVAVDPEE